MDDIEKAAEKKGEKRGERKGTLTTLFSLVNDGLLKLEEAAKRANLSEQAFCNEMKKAGFRSGPRV
ncbi:MAG TPA: hypothetical protein DCZ91_13740 [Lachnospiraceae bacterium]|nr:hypothetical protein [Lachnospiraceae bacterium]